jgi:hypothetical protein
MAFASSLRSADLSRQIGAVIARRNEIIATGANAAPSLGTASVLFLSDRISPLAEFPAGILRDTQGKKRASGLPVDQV